MLALLGYVVFMAVDSIIYVKLIFIFKLVTFIKIDEQIERKIEMYSLTVSIYKFLRLITFIVVVTNFAACIFFLIDYKLY